MAPKESGPPYQIEIDEDHWQQIESWGEQRLDKFLAFVRDHLSRTPTTPIPGKLKQLRGEYRGHYQFSVDQQRRVIYRVDEQAMRVFIEYVDSHPDWRKSRGGRITR